MAQAFGRCLSLALCGVTPQGGQARVPDPAWRAAWRWAEGQGLLCAQAKLQGRPGLWVAGPEEADELAVGDEDAEEDLEENTPADGADEEDDDEDESEDEE